MRHPSAETPLRVASDEDLYRPSALARRAAIAAKEEPTIAIRRPATYFIIAGLTAALLALEIVLWRLALPRQSSWPAAMTCADDVQTSCRVTPPVPARVWRLRDRTQPVWFADGASPIVRLEPVCLGGVVDHLVPAREERATSATGHVIIVLQRAPVFGVAGAEPDAGSPAPCCDADVRPCDGDVARTTRN